MPIMMGSQGGGLTNSLATGNPQAAERSQVEKVARVVALAQQGQGQLTKKQVNILKKIQVARNRHLKDQAAWQRKCAAHRANMDKLIAELDGQKPVPTGRFATAATAPRVTGETRRREVSRRKALRAIKR